MKPSWQRGGIVGLGLCFKRIICWRNARFWRMRWYQRWRQPLHRRERFREEPQRGGRHWKLERKRSPSPRSFLAGGGGRRGDPLRGGRGVAPHNCSKRVGFARG